MPNYTFTFDPRDEGKFRSILNRLDETEYKVIKEPAPVDPENPRYSNKEAIVEMDSECCLTFRMGMGNSVKIRRERTEEEQKEEQERLDRHTTKITVIVPPGTPGVPSTTP
jgi:hypothetical protein